MSAPFSGRLHEEPYDYFRHTPHGLRSMCHQAGLEVTEVREQGNFWSVIGHKLNSFLALKAAAGQGLAVQLGKHTHETKGATGSGRTWLLPLVVPAMLAVAGGARVLDRVAPDTTESLGYLIFARPRHG